MKNKRKKLLSFLLAFSMFFSLLTFLAPAAKAEEVFDYTRASDSLSTGLKAFADKIDLSAYHIPYTTANVKALSNFIYNSLPECFHVSSGSFGIVNNEITSYSPVYNYKKEDYDRMLGQCEAAADRILNGIRGNDALTETQKALLIHDRIIVSCEYNVSAATSTDITDPAFTMYSALVTGKAVCLGYAKAYQYLLGKVGIQCRLCHSDTLKHTWNIITVNGKDYHVDVTQDDPIYDKTGQVLHTNFMLSSAGIYKTNHKADDYDTTPNDTAYDSYFWQESEAEFCLYKGEIYYFRKADATLYRMSDKKALFTDNGKWTYGTAYWDSNYTRIAACERGILYNTAKEVKLYTPETQTFYTVFTPSFSDKNRENIFGFTLLRGWLLCDVTASPNYVSDTKQNGLQKSLLSFDGMKEDEKKSGDEETPENIWTKLFSKSQVVVLPAKTTVGTVTAALQSAVVSKVNPDTVYFATGDTVTVSGDIVCPVVILGDNTRDGEISAADARNALRYSVGLDTPDDLQKQATLVSGGKEVSSADARLILRCSVGLESF